MNHEFMDFCVACGDFLDFKDSEDSCQHVGLSSGHYFDHF